MITLENYKDIFEVCTPDVLDEIRLAILDNTDIMRFINDCGEDSYKLGQFRLAVREGLNCHVLNTQLTGKTVNNIRKCFRDGMPIDSLKAYIKPRSLTLDSDFIEKISSVVAEGKDVSKVDFTMVKENQFDIICKGLMLNYPMWLFVGKNLEPEYIRILMRGIDLGIDISQFIDEVWDKNKLILLYSYSGTIDINSVLQYVTSSFSVFQLSVLLKSLQKGIDISRIAYRDSKGVPIYNEFQMEVLAVAEENGIYSPDLFNPKVNDEKMQSMLDKILK